jgi:hypothetical protein
VPMNAGFCNSHSVVCTAAAFLKVHQDMPASLRTFDGCAVPPLRGHNQTASALPDTIALSPPISAETFHSPLCGERFASSSARVEARVMGSSTSRASPAIVPHSFKKRTDSAMNGTRTMQTPRSRRSGEPPAPGGRNEAP